jgi:hypothetical protein
LFVCYLDTRLKVPVLGGVSFTLERSLQVLLWVFCSLFS